MSQLGAMLNDFLNDTAPKPTPCTCWPPQEWVELVHPGLNVRQLLHCSGLKIFRMGDGAVIIHRGPTQARRIANIVENLLSGSGYSLVAGGQVGDKIAIYRLGAR